MKLMPFCQTFAYLREKNLILKWKTQNWQIEKRIFRIAPTVINYSDAIHRMQPNQRAHYFGRCARLDEIPPYSLLYQKYKPLFFALDKQFEWNDPMRCQCCEVKQKCEIYLN